MQNRDAIAYIIKNNRLWGCASPLFRCCPVGLFFFFLVSFAGAAVDVRRAG